MSVKRKHHEHGAQEHKTSGHVQGTTDVLYAWRTNGCEKGLRLRVTVGKDQG